MKVKIKGELKEARLLEFNLKSIEEIVQWGKGRIRRGLDGSLLIDTNPGFTLRACTGDIIVELEENTYAILSSEETERIISENNRYSLLEAYKQLKQGRLMRNTAWDKNKALIYREPFKCQATIRSGSKVDIITLEDEESVYLVDFESKAMRRYNFSESDLTSEWVEYD